MVRGKFIKLISVLGVLGFLLLLSAEHAQAVPSYARQTGMACNLCHTAFPELTSFGRSFKASGYTLTQMKQITAGANAAKLELNDILPLSLMLQTSYTRTEHKQPGTQNNNVEFPQQLSLFLAGEITNHVGSFIQATYTQEEDNLSMDNSDIRLADQSTLAGKEIIYGLTLNNNPTVADLWNSTPAWSFPYASADSVPTPAAGALIDGGLAQAVAGLGAYALWDDRLYADVTAYRTAEIGQLQPTNASEDTIENVAPYWRLAWQHKWGDNYLELGHYGLYAQLYPQGISGQTDKYTDVAFDLTYERKFGTDLFTLHTTYIYEDQDLNASHAAGDSENQSNDLNTFRADAHYYFDGSVVLSLAYFMIRGDSDNILYSPDQVDGSRNGSPDSDGMIAEVGYYPWQNLRLSLQYTAYFQFNGSSNNYDGFGRDASDNNTLYALVWLVW